MDTENEQRKVRVISDELLWKEKKIIRRIYIYVAGGGGGGGGNERLREFVMELIPILEKFSGRLKWGSLLRSSFFLWTFFLPDND